MITNLKMNESLKDRMLIVFARAKKDLDELREREGYPYYSLKEITFKGNTHCISFYFSNGDTGRYHEINPGYVHDMFLAKGLIKRLRKHFFPGKFIFCGVNNMCANCKKLTYGLGYDPECPKCNK